MQQILLPHTYLNVSITQLQSSEQLLTQIEQLKRLHVLQDFDTLNTELDRDVISLEAR
jgi:hypothetical protein